MKAWIAGRPSAIFDNLVANLLAAALIGAGFVLWGYLGQLPAPVVGLIGFVAFVITAMAAGFATVLRRGFWGGPPWLAESVEWLRRVEFVCIDHVQNYELSPNDDGQSTRVRVEIHRLLKNTANGEREFRFGLAIDEWGFAGKPSAFLKLTYRVGTGTWQSVDQNRSLAEPSALVLEEQRVEVAAGQTVEVESVFEETRRPNDEHSMVFRYSTQHPVVHVKATGSLCSEVRFAHPEQARVMGSPGGQYRLTGTLLPEQRIVLRWWPDPANG